jgi:tRNA dimethylallyltransferase
MIILPITSPVLILIGPTAIGKTALSLEIADTFQCEIISMDSMQVYRHMDIGTAKVSREAQEKIPHHLIDIIDPDEQYDAALFARDALHAVEEIIARGNIPLLTGGTGLYLSSLINGMFASPQVSQELRSHLRNRLLSDGREALHRELMHVDQESGLRIHPNDTQRLLRGLEIFYSTGQPWSAHLRHQKESGGQQRFSRLLLLGLTCDRDRLYGRIKKRTIDMMSDAFEQEVKSLLNKGYTSDLPSMQSIGYRHMLECIQGEWDRESAIAALIRDTKRYAKRQMTWFRNQQDVQWYDINHPQNVTQAIASFV